MLESLNVTKATGDDNIPARFLRDSARVISYPISYLINLPLKTKNVPEELNMARVIPLYKKGDRNYKGNYRPVSIHPIISKNLDRAVYDQLYSYLDKKGLMYKFQPGFRSTYSTKTCLTYITDKIRMNIDNGLFTGMILIDI